MTDPASAPSTPFPTPPAIGLRDISLAELDGALGATRRPLGSGGFGAVFRGTLDGAAVAVKLLHTQGLQERGEAYRSEVQLLARLRHRHIVAIYAACEERHALVMELMEGGSADCLIFVQYQLSTVC